MEQDDDEAERAPLEDPAMYPWRVRVGIVGDLYRSDGKQWRAYEPNGPISFYPNMVTATATPANAEGAEPPAALRIVPIKRKSTTEDYEKTFNLPIIPDTYTKGDRVPTSVSGKLSNFMEFDVQDIKDSGQHQLLRLVTGHLIGPNMLQYVMPNWDPNYVPVGIIKRRISGRIMFGVIMKKSMQQTIDLL